MENDAMLAIDIEGSFDEELLDEAIELLAEAAAARPEAARYRRTLAEALIARRRFADAVAHLERLRGEDFTRRTAYLLAFALHRLGRVDEAWELLEDLDADDAVGFVRLHALRGRILHERGRFGEAANELARGLILDPSARDLRFRMARSLVAHADRTGAGESVWRRALKILVPLRPRPDQIDEWHALLGRVHLALMYPVEALRHLEASRQADGGDKQLLVGLASLLEGAIENARRWLAAAVAVPRVRARCARHLEEIAAGGTALLASMSDDASHRALEALADDDFLTAIFGEGADEVGAILRAGRTGRDDASARTRGEAGDEGGRLFASPEGDRDARDEAFEARPPGPHAPDRLHPQTFVDLGQALDLERRDRKGAR